eukprot:1457818-Pleurochrysis_carterae.AAC.1
MHGRTDARTHATTHRRIGTHARALRRTDPYTCVHVHAFAHPRAPAQGEFRCRSATATPPRPLTP